MFALLTAVSNAAANVLQRRAASEEPAPVGMHLSLIAELAKRKIWLAGVSLVVVAALFQAAALATGPIALVQPIFIIELPAALLLAALATRVPPSQLPWAPIAMVTVGLGAGLAIANPSGGVDRASNTSWLLALIATAAFLVVTIGNAIKLPGEPRAVLLGLAAACGYALTAALMKEAMAALDESAASFFTCWQLYGTAIVGVGSLFLLQNALQAGTLVASQPMLTVGDALISISYGVTLYGEHLRVSGWLLPELVALGLIVYGCVRIASSPLASGKVARVQ